VPFENTESVPAKYGMQMVDFLCVVGLKGAFQRASFKVFTAL
jgi:phosphatidylinositol kinase/protein kinase (PI-3  family)